MILQSENSLPFFLLLNRYTSARSLTATFTCIISLWLWCARRLYDCVDLCSCRLPTNTIILITSKRHFRFFKAKVVSVVSCSTLTVAAFVPDAWVRRTFSQGRAESHLRTVVWWSLWPPRAFSSVHQHTVIAMCLFVSVEEAQSSF